MLDALPDKSEPCNPLDSWGDARFGHLCFRNLLYITQPLSGPAR